MPVASRALILGALLALGTVGVRTGGTPAPAPAEPPLADAIFAAPGWTAGPSTTQEQNEVLFVSRRYSAETGDASAVLSVAVSPQAKKVYRAGPEIPFAGAGYAIAAAPAGLVRDGRWSAIVASRGGERFLLVTTQGERRGLLGNGAIAWIAATLDGILGSPNVYFQATLVVPLAGRDDGGVARRSFELADRVFAQLARWDAD